MANSTEKGRTAPATEEWDTVSEARTKMVFDTDGDTWEGFWEGPEAITDLNTGEVYDYLNFRDSAGDGYTTSASYQLKRAFQSLPVGSYVRIQRLSQTAVAKGKMTNFRVQIRK